MDDPIGAEPGRTEERPDDPVRSRVLDHTLAVLLGGGSGRFSMNAVATSAKASKETLYRHFGDKTGLLRAALVRSASQIAPLLHVGLDGASSPEDRLRRLGRNYLDACFRPESVALQRIAVADAEHGLGPLFAEEITEPAVAVVEQEFASLGRERPREDAEAFLGLIQGKLHERVMLGAEIDDLDGRIEAQLDHAFGVIAPYLGADRT